MSTKIKIPSPSAPGPRRLYGYPSGPAGFEPLDLLGLALALLPVLVVLAGIVLGKPYLPALGAP